MSLIPRGLAASFLLLPFAHGGGAAAQTSLPGINATRPDQNPPRRRGGRQVRQPAQVRKSTIPSAPFVLREVEVTGSTLSGASLSEAYHPFIGKHIDAKALGTIVDQVSHAYESSDIALYTVLVPEQRFDGGQLRLSVVEGHVGSVEVRGDLRKVRGGLLRAYLRRIEQERPLHKSTLQRVISLIRDMPGLFPDLSFQRGAAEGSVKLVINAREKPVQLAVGVNNRGTALLGRTQVQADAYVNGIISGGDQLHASLVLPTHISRFQYGSASYLTPLDADGDAVQVNGGYLRTRPPVLKLDDATYRLKGRAISFGGQVTRPLIRSYQSNLYATLGLDGSDSHNAFLGYILSNDRVRTVRAALSLSLSSARNELSLSGTFSQGLDALGARAVAGQAVKGFRKLNAKVGDSRKIGRNLIIRASAAGQLTADRLPASEQLALGGDEYGRAYEAALVAGDEGFAGSLEIAYRPGKLPNSINGSEIYAFTDAGRVFYHARFGLPSTESHIASVGTGARFQIAKRDLFEIEAVRGLTNPVPYEDREKWRLLFSFRSLI